MQYAIREGVVFTKICDEYLLVATRNAWDYCPRVVRLSSLGAYFFQQILEGKSSDDIIYSYQILGKKSHEEATKRFLSFRTQLTKNGYLID